MAETSREELDRMFGLYEGLGAEIEQGGGEDGNGAAKEG